MRLTGAKESLLLMKATDVKIGIEQELRKKNYYDVLLCGSIAKGTALIDTSDVDLFIRFKDNVNEKDFPGIITSVADKLREKGYGVCKIVHGTYPFIETVYRNITFNIVPCRYCVGISDVKYTTDRTPFHVKWVNKHLTDSQKEDVTQLKLLLKSNGIYGADDTTKGFSGYVCEVLIHKYGNYAALIKAFSEINDKTKRRMLKILDPVDKKRHLHAAISNRTFGKFIQACRKMIGKGQITNFDIDLDLSWTLRNHMVKIPMETDEVPQIEKKSKQIIHILKSAGFEVLYSFPYGKSLVLLMKDLTVSGFYLKPNIISLTNKDAVAGIPMMNTTNHVKNFITNDLTYSAIAYRQPITVSEVLTRAGYKTEHVRQDKHIIEVFLRH